MPSIFLPQTPLGLDTQQAISSLEHRPPVSLKVNKKMNPGETNQRLSGFRML